MGPGSSVITCRAYVEFTALITIMMKGCIYEIVNTMKL